MVDYSKWKDIEISDDEDETHPNIDTPSLFRWRHQARIERMEEHEREKKLLQQKKQKASDELAATRKKLTDAQNTCDEEVEKMKKKLKELEDQFAEVQVEEEEFLKKEKKLPWNVDTISQPGFNKTVVNKSIPAKKQVLTDEEIENRYHKFVSENEQLLKKFGMLRKYDDSKRFLEENPQLLCEDTSSYLTMWCVRLAIEEKLSLMEHVSHQAICMQYVMELANQLDLDPRSCFGKFFTNIQIAEPDYKKAFQDEVAGLQARVKQRAKEKVDKLVQEMEEDEKKARIGPGGLDPVEVFESLPEDLQKCFEAKDTKMLMETLRKMGQVEGEYHMKRCIDAGMWVPEASEDDPSEPFEPVDEPVDPVEPVEPPADDADEADE